MQDLTNWVHLESNSLLVFYCYFSSRQGINEMKVGETWELQIVGGFFVAVVVGWLVSFLGILTDLE